MAVADGAKGVESVKSVTSIRVRPIAGDSKTGWVDRVAAVTAAPRSRRKLLRAPPIWPVPPMTRIGGIRSGFSLNVGAVLDASIGVDVSNHPSCTEW